MIFVIGGRGRLGKAITTEYAAENAESIERAVYEDWSQNDSRDKVTRYFDTKAAEGSVIFVTSGLLDPRLSQEELLRINYFLPKNIIEGVTKIGFKVVTFGTVMESLLNIKNPYVLSKAALGQYVADVASARCPVTHLRIHTLFGVGEPSPFMFQGQMLDAIRRDVPFEMTTGNQLREYHHLEDEGRAIRRIAESISYGLLDVSHGQPVSLKDIAESVFISMGKRSLLRIGSLRDPPEENYKQKFTCPSILNNVQFRDSLPAIVDYIKACTTHLKSANSQDAVL